MVHRSFKLRKGCWILLGDFKLSWAWWYPYSWYSLVDLQSWNTLINLAECVPTFNKRAAASLFLHQAFLSGLWSLWWLVEWARGVQFVHTLCGALVKGLGVVDGADSSGQGWRRATVALVHPGPVAHAAHLALHLPRQVAVGPVIQALHTVLCFSVGLWCLGQEEKWSRAVQEACEHLAEGWL